MKDLFMNESLLDGVETDEIEDDADVYVDVDESREVMLKITTDHIRIRPDSFYKSVFDRFGYIKTVDFHHNAHMFLFEIVETGMTLDGMFALLCRLMFVTTNESVNIANRNAMKRIFYIYDKQERWFICKFSFNEHNPDICLGSSLFDIVREFFPDKSEDEIISSFVKECARVYFFDDYERNSFNVSYTVNGKEVSRLFDRNGNVLFDSESDFILCNCDFRDGFLPIKNPNPVQYGCEFNYIDKEGHLLSDVWYGKCIQFDNGFGIVMNSKCRWNYIDKNGDILTPDVWYSRCEPFSEGFGRVLKVNGRMTFVDKKGLMMDNDYAYCSSFHDGYSIVQNDKGKFNFIDKKGSLLSENVWFESCRKFSEGFGLVYADNKRGWNYIDKQGGMLLDVWCSNCKSFHGGFGIVKSASNNEESFVDRNGNLLDNKHFSKCYDFKDGVAKVENEKGQFNYIDRYGKEVFNKWISLKYNGDYVGGFLKVENTDDNTVNFMNLRGDYILNKWINADVLGFRVDNGVLFISDGTCVDSDGSFVAIV